jgi:hypothetical protein
MERLFRRKKFDMVGKGGFMIAFLAFSGVLGKGGDIKSTSAQHTQHRHTIGLHFHIIRSEAFGERLDINVS